MRKPVINKENVPPNNEVRLDNRVVYQTKSMRKPSFHRLSNLEDAYQFSFGKSALSAQ